MIDFVAIDFETANEKPESVCALGVAEVRDGVLGVNNSWLICPPQEFFTFRKRNRDIHHIGRGDVKDKEDFGELWPTISGYIRDRLVVAHSAAGTEINMLRKLFEHFGIEAPQFQYACTCAIAKSAWPEKPGRFGLSDVADYLGFSFEHHDPAEDARACALTVLQACEQAKVNSLEELSERLRVNLTPFTMDRFARESRSRHAIYGVEISIGDITNEFDVEEGCEEEQSLDGFSHLDIKRCCQDAGVWDRGVKLFDKTAVEVTSRSGMRWSANVKGSGKEPYQVTIDRSLKATCTCQAWINSSKRFCKHTVAVALAWAAEGGAPPIEELSDDDKNLAIVDTIVRMPAAECKEILQDLAEHEPELIYRLLFDAEIETKPK